MSSFIDCSEVKATNPIEEVAERLGLTMTKNGNQLRGQCPSGEGDDRGLVITPTKGVWYSFPAQKGGDCISLVSFTKGIGSKESAQWILEGQQPKESIPRGSGFKELEYLETDHPAVQALGFDEGDAKLFGIGYCPKGIFKGLVAVPIRILDGTLVGYIGITDCKLPKQWQW